ncbi:hypothetical protein DFH08DRAFT_820379 [Mycena albidolilacea]|uniref:Uncharacterized protein n=1 Tax=Mycena albidolilacea TaxID=1033008 RepID=A0AAD6ZCS5_9AGAR|nr:hypothetical protein DFH08DRAFT_820379 [Mycena albidolilacea]
MYWLENCYLWIILKFRARSCQYTGIQGTITPLSETPEPPSGSDLKYDRHRNHPVQTSWILSESRERIVSYEIGGANQSPKMLDSEINLPDSNDMAAGNGCSTAGRAEGLEKDCDEDSLPDLLTKKVCCSMPTTSDRQLLLQAALHQAERDLDDYMEEERLNSDDDMELDRQSNGDGDSSASSDTSSTSSSSSSGSSDSDASMASRAGSISDDNEDEVYAARMSANGELLKAIADTRVLNPHKVTKSSQLHLVLVDFKADDSKRFRRNLRVSPETFDALVLRIEQQQQGSSLNRIGLNRFEPTWFEP